MNTVKTLYLDFETSSGDPKLSSLNPWHNCSIAGAAITWDDHPYAYYVPKHLGYDWLEKLQPERWVNHNVKYDAHVMENNLGWSFQCPLVDTVTLAKIVNSDRFRYSLSALSKDWLNEDISVYEEAMAAYLYRNKDYGVIPDDIIGEYACQDVFTERKLYEHISKRIPEQCYGIRDIEIDLTRVLFDMEQTGMPVNPIYLDQIQLGIMERLIQLEATVDEMAGMPVRPHVNEDCFELFCSKYDLPVLSYNESGKASFDKSALKSYLKYPGAPVQLVEKIMEYRKLHTLLTYFVDPYVKFNIDGWMHPSYNQSVRTGRMSCRQPNAQQLSPEAKKLIVPPEDWSIISIDYSQIEFRIIVHYIKNEDAIRTYNENPKTDFHQWVANMCKIPRSPAKNVNFAIGYGGGKGRVLTMLANDMSLMSEFMEAESDDFGRLCAKRAHDVYEQYHTTLPELRHTSKRAQYSCIGRGYVFNIFGRRRHLPPKRSHRAFNALCQSTAADLIKAKAVAVHATKPAHWKMFASVHDSLDLLVPTEEVNDKSLDWLALLMEDPIMDLRVPIKCSIGFSTDNWNHASSSSTMRDIEIDV